MDSLLLLAVFLMIARYARRLETTHATHVFARTSRVLRRVLEGAGAVGLLLTVAALVRSFEAVAATAPEHKAAVLTESIAVAMMVWRITMWFAAGGFVALVLAWRWRLRIR